MKYKNEKPRRGRVDLQRCKVPAGTNYVKGTSYGIAPGTAPATVSPTTFGAASGIAPGITSGISFATTIVNSPALNSGFRIGSTIASLEYNSVFFFDYQDRSGKSIKGLVPGFFPLGKVIIYIIFGLIEGEMVTTLVKT